MTMLLREGRRRRRSWLLTLQVHRAVGGEDDQGARCSESPTTTLPVLGSIARPSALSKLEGPRSGRVNLASSVPLGDNLSDRVERGCR